MGDTDEEKIRFRIIDESDWKKPALIFFKMNIKLAIPPKHNSTLITKKTELIFPFVMTAESK